MPLLFVVASRRRMSLLQYNLHNEWRPKNSISSETNMHVTPNSIMAALDYIFKSECMQKSCQEKLNPSRQRSFLSYPTFRAPIERGCYGARTTLGYTWVLL